MQKRSLLFTASMLISTLAYADWDPKLEAEEAAQRAAAQRQAAIQHEKAEQMKREAMDKYNAEQTARERKELGAQAEGRSDAEVHKLYEAKNKQAMNEALALTAQGQKAIAQNAGKPIPKVNMAEMDGDMKAATGKSFADLSKMSDKELEAFAKEMEKREGK